MVWRHGENIGISGEGSNGIIMAAYGSNQNNNIIGILASAYIGNGKTMA